MKKFLLSAVIMFCLSTNAFAGLKTLGSGDSMRLDASSFPAEMKKTYETVVLTKCLKCHNLERTVEAVKTGVAPISSLPFDKKATKAYGIKMMRKPESDMNKQEIKSVVNLLNYLIDESGK